MAELSPPGFDFMVRAVHRLAIVHALSDVRGCGTRCGSAVLRLVWNDKSRVVDCRTERDSGDHRQNGKHLAGLPVPICDMRRTDSYHVVGSRRTQGPTGCRALGGGAARYKHAIEAEGMRFLRAGSMLNVREVSGCGCGQFLL